MCVFWGLEHISVSGEIVSLCVCRRVCVCVFWGLEHISVSGLWCVCVCVGVCFGV